MGDRARLDTLLRFGLVSLAGTTVDFSALWVLHAHAGVPVVPASLASAEVSIINSFVWSELWAFRGHTSRSSLPGRFVACNGLYLSMIVSTLVVVGLLNLLFGPCYFLLYKAATLPVNFIWNYLWSTRFLWRPARTPAVLVSDPAG